MYVESTWVKILRFAVVVYIIIGVISGIVLAGMAESTPAGLLAFVISLVVTLLSAAVVMVFLDMAADINATAQMNHEMLQILKSKGVGSASPTSSTGNAGHKPTLSSVAATHETFSDYWRCSHCADKNPANARVCKGCGKDK